MICLYFKKKNKKINVLLKIKYFNFFVCYIERFNVIGMKMNFLLSLGLVYGKFYFFFGVKGSVFIMILYLICFIFFY